MPGEQDSAIFDDAMPVEGEAPAAPEPQGEPQQPKLQEQGEQPQGGDAQRAQVVPLAVMLAERGKFKQDLEAKDTALADLNKQIADLREKLPKQDEPKEEPPPDYLDDPKGYVDSQLAAARNTVKALQEQLSAADKRVTETREQIAAREQQERFVSALQGAEAQFAEKTPDYMDALTHVRNVRAAQLKLFAPNATEQEIIGQIQREELAAGAQALRANTNPAQLVYDYAKTLGYAPKQAVQQQQQPRQPAGQQAAQQRDLGAAATLGASGAPPGQQPVADDDDGLGALDQALAARFGR